MTNTRHATDSSQYHQSRYMSDPAFAEQRGLLGNLVAERASILISRRKRELLFFLQAESLKPGGLKCVASELLAMFPERLGSPTMHRIGIKKGARYTAKETENIYHELGWRDDRFDIGRLISDTMPETKHKVEPVLVDECLDRCRRSASGLSAFLADLCLNPNLEFREPGEDEEKTELERRRFEESFSEDHEYLKEASVGYFRDIIESLFEYQRRKIEAAKSSSAETTLTHQLFEAMDYAIESRGLVIVKGNPRIGKSTIAKAWCEMNPGRTRYISLEDISDDAGFYRTIARPLGLACTYTRKACELRDRISDMLRKSGLMLVLDEAQYIWPQCLRPTALPQRVNWIMTSLINHEVPILLIATPQFIDLQHRVEKNTGWTSEQFKGRIKRFVNLPEELSAKDLEAIARFHLPDASKETITKLVGYCMTQQTYIAGMVNAIDEARYDAKKQGREKLTYEDIERVTSGSGSAVKTNEALARAYDADDRRRKNRLTERLARRSGLGTPRESPVKMDCMRPATTLEIASGRNNESALANGRNEREELVGECHHV